MDLKLNNEQIKKLFAGERLFFTVAWVVFLLLLLIIAYPGTIKPVSMTVAEEETAEELILDEASYQRVINYIQNLEAGINGAGWPIPENPNPFGEY